MTPGEPAMSDSSCGHRLVLSEAQGRPVVFAGGREEMSMVKNDGHPEAESLPELAELAAHFKEHERKLRRMLESRIDPSLSSKIDADDLLSETFLLARRRWQRFAESGMTVY